MRRIMFLVVLGLVMLAAGWSTPSGKAGKSTREVDARSLAPQCVCYCKSEKKGVGAVACMGGFLMRCQDDGKGRNCGWDNVKNSKNEDTRCNGEC
jgi:hypothetical protein